MIENLKHLLEGQNILVISPQFFGYENRIIQRLNELGANAVWIDDRPTNSVLGKVIMRYCPILYKNKIRNHYRNNIHKTFNQILVISPESISLSIINLLKEQTKASKMILYMWDTFKNKKRAQPIFQYFDKCLTFDPDDANYYNFIFRPLFFTSFGNDSSENIIKYDLSFIGTGHSDRVKIIEFLKNQCRILNLNYYFYLYLQSPLIFILFKLFKKNLKNIKKSYFYYNAIPYEEYIKISEETNVILDLEHPKQKGLTIRTFEVLGKEKKIITTNQNIKFYDFFNENNIYILDRFNPILDKNFFSKKYKKISRDLYYKYSIDGLLEDIFS